MSQVNKNKVKSILLRLLPIAMDWAVIYAIWEVKAYIYNKIPLYERQFSIYDVTISREPKPDTLKWENLLHYTLTACCIVIVIVEIIKRRLKFYRYLPHAILGLFLSYLITNTICDFIKNYAGRPRPDFLAVCDIDFEKVEQQFLYYQNLTRGIDIENYGPRVMFNSTICRGKRSKVESEQKSFPSGHSSFAFVTMTYLTLYLAGQLRIFDDHFSVFDGMGRAWKCFIACIPLFFATYVPLCRVFDNRHHWQDVTAGSFIGIFFGIVIYYFVYPSLRDPNCDIPIRHRSNKKEKIDEIEEDDVPQDKKPEEIV